MDMNIWQAAWDAARDARRANTRTAWLATEDAWRAAWENTERDEEAHYAQMTAYTEMLSAHRKVLSAKDP